jgi:hypothetical protein
VTEPTPYLSTIASGQISSALLGVEAVCTLRK